MGIVAVFEEVESSWTLDSDGYDDLIQKELTNRRNMRYWSHELAKQLGNKPLRVLEVGCGPGFFTVMLCRLGHHVKAIDGSEGMIANARANVAADGQKAIIEEQDAVTLPNEENESYDVIISRDVVWTLYDPEQAFRRWKEVLAPGGRVIYYDGNYRRDDRSLKRTVWEWTSRNILQVVLDRKRPGKKTNHADSAAFEDLPMVTRERPGADVPLLQAAGFHDIQVTDDKYRNSPTRIEYWKYGYQGRKFRVIAHKEEA